MSDSLAPEAEALGTNITPPAPGPAAPPAAPEYAMAMGEQFTREEYHQVGWTDEQLLAVGKMFIPTTRVDLDAPLGMPAREWIVLDDNDDIPPSGLFVGHNGTGYLLGTGLPIPVPKFILGILDDAIMQAPMMDPKTQQVVGWRPRPRYTYRRVPAPTEA